MELSISVFMILKSVRVSFQCFLGCLHKLLSENEDCFLRELKFSYGNIAKEVGCLKSSAERVYKKFQKENTIDDLARPML